MRARSGSRHLIESNLKEKMTETNLQLEDLFETKMYTFANINETLKIHENLQQHVVVCKNMNELVKRMIEGRNIPGENALVRIGIDGGGGFLSVFDLVKFKQPSTGNRQGERFCDSGVKKVIIIGIVPDIQENYPNLKRMWLETFIREYTIATDLKLCNILLGVITHSSTHPCCWCDVKKGNLDKKGVSRTIANTMELFWNYFEARAEKKLRWYN